MDYGVLDGFVVGGLGINRFMGLEGGLWRLALVKAYMMEK